MTTESVPDTSTPCEVALQESEAMATHILGRGYELPTGTLQLLADARSDTGLPLHTLQAMHAQLRDVIAPATPRTIAAMERSREGRFGWLGSVDIARHMMKVSLVFLFMMLGFGLTHQVNTASLARGILDSEGIPLALNLMFLLSASGLGAAFATLHRAQSFINKDAYDSRYDSAYWMQLVLGLTAGLIMAEMIPIDWRQVDSGLGKPTVALLGGFSASMVHRVLNRLVETIESLFNGGKLEGVREKIRYQQAVARELGARRAGTAIPETVRASHSTRLRAGEFAPPHATPQPLSVAPQIPSQPDLDEGDDPRSHAA